MIDVLVKVLAGASGGAAGKITEFAFGQSDRDSPEDESRDEIEGQSIEVIKQVGQKAETPEEIPAALDGLSITFNHDETEKQFNWVDEAEEPDTDD
ncbi:hypothetical protein [Haloarchaeobius iranensis]|uniref:Uncharacterized protein n=1 Tax=Haloarchaeobius iranensis TaxID=996166 RepID=A0A1H0B884_9EURY|nr:hypothetical protein [Haloarchaeobius iranensis]SDN41811.1 hypothetical protein SAMN05192554_1356 [Haloarchaeobius iranensis]